MALALKKMGKLRAGEFSFIIALQSYWSIITSTGTIGFYNMLEAISRVRFNWMGLALVLVVVNHIEQLTAGMQSICWSNDDVSILKMARIGLRHLIGLLLDAQRYIIAYFR